MFHPESEHEHDAVSAAERILREDRLLNAESVINAASEIIATTNDDSQVLDIDLSADMLEFLSSVFVEQHIIDQVTNGSNFDLESFSPLASLENASATLSEKFATLNQLSGRFPGKTQLSRREVNLIREQLVGLISDLQKNGDLIRLKIFTKLAKSLNKEFAKAEKKLIARDRRQIEGEVVLESPME